MKDPGNQWAEKPLSVRLDQIKKQWLNLGPQQLLMLDNLILSAEYLEEQLAMKTELSPNATPRTQAARHNMGSVEEPHYVVDEEVAAGLERELSVALSATAPASFRFKTYDVKCGDLARHFLAEFTIDALRRDKLAEQMARQIQVAVEDFLHEEGLGL